MTTAPRDAQATPSPEDIEQEMERARAITDTLALVMYQPDDGEGPIRKNIYHLQREVAVLLAQRALDARREAAKTVRSFAEDWDYTGKARLAPHDVRDALINAAAAVEQPLVLDDEGDSR